MTRIRDALPERPPPPPSSSPAAPASAGAGLPPSPGGRPGAPRSLLAVDGIDGSGKSLLAARLVQAASSAGISSVAFAVDDFRRPVDWRAPQRAEADIYYDDYYDLPLLDHCLRSFLDGAPFVDIPVFDVTAHRLDGQRRIAFDGASAAIVEGIFALRISTVAAQAALIYLRTSFATARSRILARDTARGRTSSDVTHRIDSRYFPAQERYLRECDPVARAEVVIDNEDWRAPSLVRFDAQAVQAKTGGRPGVDWVALVSTALGTFATPTPVG